MSSFATDNPLAFLTISCYSAASDIKNQLGDPKHFEKLNSELLLISSSLVNLMIGCGMKLTEANPNLNMEACIKEVLESLDLEDYPDDDAQRRRNFFSGFSLHNYSELPFHVTFLLPL